MSEDGPKYTLDDMLLSKRAPSDREGLLATAALVVLFASPCILTASAPTIMNYLHRNYPSLHSSIIHYLESK